MVEGEFRREEESQLIHDHVIGEVAETFLDKYKIAYMNQGTEKNRAVKGKYPDIIIYKTAEDDREDRPTIIVEIETSSTVDKYELQNQWLPYIESDVPIFILFTPKEVQDKAGELLKEFNIEEKVKLYCYETDKQGNILFQFK